MSVALTYSMVIEWSVEDQLFIARMPEFGPGAKTHGLTYEEAAKNGREVLEMLIESCIADGEKLPLPQVYKDSKGVATSPVVKSRSARPAARKFNQTIESKNRGSKKHVTA